ncbi:MAG TPA: ArsA-related P-loop ATPase [Capillimicrobium sp.]|jgi:anion-transporting  ArsA/GET3 family ATPase
MPALLDHPLLFVTGKGGVGKSTVALALALRAREAGRRVVVGEVGGQGRIARMYGREPLADGRELEVDDGLFTMTVDVEAALREWFGTLLPRRLATLLVSSGTFAAFANAAPGAKELAAAVKLWELGQPKRWRGGETFDTVIVDAPASGHGLGLLRTPATFASLARVGPLGKQAAAVRDAFADPRHTAVVAVTAPSELSVSETLELEARTPLGAIVANGVLAKRFTRDQADAVAAGVDGAIGALVARNDASVREQQAQLRRLRKGATADVHALPWVAQGDLGVDDVDTLSRALARL